MMASTGRPAAANRAVMESDVEGNLDKSAIPDLQEFMKKSYQYTSKQIVKDARKVGIRPSR